MEIGKPIAFFIIFVVVVSLGIIVIQQSGSSANIIETTLHTDNTTFLTGLTANYPRAVTSGTATVVNQTWLEFDGVNDHVTMGDPIFNMTSVGAITVSAWVRKEGNTNGDDADIVNYYTGASGERNFVLALQNNITYFRLQSIGGDGTYATAGTTQLDIGEWYFVTGTWNGTTLQVYLNGVQEGTPDIMLNSSYVDSNNLYIGRGRYATYWNGSIDEVRIYNDSLSQEEILALYHLGR